VSCNICDDSLHELLLSGDLRDFPYNSHPDPDVNCPSCAARPRIKTFRLVYDEHVRPRLTKPRAQMRALEIAGNPSTRRLIGVDVGSVVDAALVGRAMRTDIRDLREFEDDSLSLVTAVAVLDFVIEIGLAFDAVWRVLESGGLFVFSLMPYRLTDDSAAPREVDRLPWIDVASAEGPDDSLVPSIEVGKQWLVDRLTAHGFRAEQYDYVDLFSGHPSAWFVGRKIKPAPPVA
jgi:hypothetical protein